MAYFVVGRIETEKPKGDNTSCMVVRPKIFEPGKGWRFWLDDTYGSRYRWKPVVSAELKVCNILDGSCIEAFVLSENGFATVGSSAGKQVLAERV